MINYRRKGSLEISRIKSTRGWYEIVQNSTTKQYHLRRKAKNGQILRWTEGYINRSDALISLYYPGFDGHRDLLLNV